MSLSIRAHLLARFPLALMVSLHHFLFPKSGSARLATQLALLWGCKGPCHFLPKNGLLFIFSFKGEDLDIAKWASRASCMRFSPVLKLPKPKCKNSFWKTSACHCWAYGNFFLLITSTTFCAQYIKDISSLHHNCMESRFAEIHGFFFPKALIEEIDFQVLDEANIGINYVKEIYV